MGSERVGRRLGCLWVWGWVGFCFLCIFGVWIEAVLIGLRNELREWIGLSAWTDERVDRTEKFWGLDWEMSYVDQTEKWKRETHRAWRGSTVWGRGSWAFIVREMVELGVTELGEHLLLRVRVRKLKRKLFEVKMRTEIVLHLRSLILWSTLKIFLVWPNFPDQPNSLFYGKTFLKLVWSQNKHSLSYSYSYSWKYL